MLRIDDIQEKRQQTAGIDINLIDYHLVNATLHFDAKKLPDDPLEFTGGHLDHCRVVGLRNSKVLLQYVFK